MAIIGVELEKAVQILSEGGVIGLPTETVYGLAANALDEQAVLSVFEIKQRPTFDPLIIHIHDFSQLNQWTENIPEEAVLLAKQFWPGPLTLLLPKKTIIPDVVTAGLERVAVRVPAHPLTLALLSQLTFPLAAPSANPFGYISPTQAQHVQNQLGEKIPYILDGGACQVGLESTIVGWENEKAIIYRLGGLEVESIELILGYKPEVRISSSKPAAPGMLESHYAPKHPLYLGNISQLVQQFPEKKAAILSFHQSYPFDLKQFILSPSQDLKEASKNLFSYLRELDKLEIDCIFGELAPETGLGLAINDRLRRAAVKK